MHPDIKIFSSKESLAQEFGNLLQKTSVEKQQVFIALSGGSTPKIIFDLLATDFKDKIEWHKLWFFWGDERCVPPDYEESNYGMTRKHLLNKLPIIEEQVFRIKGELSPELAVADYSETLKLKMPLKNGLPVFDLMLLGMGDDGHTASIFPHQIELWESQNICEIAIHPDSGQKRITLTGRVINNSEKIIFLVTGAGKAEKVAEIIYKKSNYKSYPASLVDKCKSIWMLDKPAASLLGQ